MPHPWALVDSSFPTFREGERPQTQIAALVTLSDLLAQKRIYATEAEMKVLIEAAVAEFNEAFKKPLLDGSTNAATYRPYEGSQQSDSTEAITE
mgnify:CR=1 FL=1